MNSEREYVDTELEELERLAATQKELPPTARDFAPLLSRASLLLNELECAAKNYVDQRVDRLCLAAGSVYVVPQSDMHSWLRVHEDQ